MLLTATLPAVEFSDKASYLRLMAMFAEVFNRHVDWAVAHGSISKKLLHEALYDACRRDFSELPSALIQTARDTAVEAVISWRTKTADAIAANKKITKINAKRDKANVKKMALGKRPRKLMKLRKLPDIPRKTATSAVRYDTRTLTKRGDQLTLSTLDKRDKVISPVPECFHYFTTHPDWKLKGAAVCYVDGRFVIKLNYSGTAPPKSTNTDSVGVDRGIVNTAALSTGKIYTNAKRRATQRRYLHTRSTLQAQGTRSAKRHLKRLSGREKRFSLDSNRCLAKELVALPFGIIVLEDLSKIRDDKDYGRRRNRWLSSWSFAQFQSTIAYKAEFVGKTIIYVDPRYTSQMCSACGYVSKKNRKKHRFCCLKCGFRAHADINAAINIRQKYIDALRKQIEKSARCVVTLSAAPSAEQAAMSAGRTHLPVLQM